MKATALLRSLKARKLERPSAVDEEIREVEQSVLPASRHHGLALLPDEVFLQILDVLGNLYQYDTHMQGQAICTLSVVSRRFRDGLLSTPSFWTYWSVPSLSASSALTQKFIQRSTNCEIILDTGNNTYPKVRSSLEEIALFLRSRPFEENIDRVVEMRLDAFTAGAAFTAGFGLKPCAFKTLKTLVVVGSGVYDQTVSTVTSRQIWSISPVFDFWTFPAIKNLSIIGTIPPLHHFQGVTRLILGHLEGVVLTVFRSLSAGLSQISGLLHLELKGFNIGPKQNVSFGEIDTIVDSFELPSVTAFSASTSSCTAEPHLRLLMSKLRLPRVSKLRIEISGDLSNGENKALLAFLSRGGIQTMAEMDTVKSFQLSLEANDETKIPFSQIVTATPDLEELTIKYKSTIVYNLGENPSSDSRPRRLPSLRTIRIVVIEEPY